ncbi:MAG: hypothetical protein QM729_01240 [Solirubrobacterales bacterium]
MTTDLDRRILARRPMLAALLVLALLIGVGSSARGAEAAETLYYANSVWTTIGYATLTDPPAIGELTTKRGSSATVPAGMALDPAQGRAYFGAYYGISWVSLDGTEHGDLNLGAITPSDLTSVSLDPASGKIYWTDQMADKIGWANLDGSGGGYLGTGAATVDMPIGIVVDPSLGRVYWVNTGAKSISYANLDGGGGGDLVSGTEPAFDNPQGLAIDPVGERVYWTNVYGQTIYSEALSGVGLPTELNITGADPDNPAGIAIDTEARRLYWGNANADTVSYAKLDGSGGGQVDIGDPEYAWPSYPSLLKAPVSTERPRLSRVGDTLGCSSGSWGADTVAAFLYRAPSSYSYAWTRDGTTVAGASGSTYVPTASGSYACAVTGSNPAGSTSATSDALTVEMAGAATATATLPKLTGLRVTPRRIGTAGARRGRARAGATIRFHLNEAARVTFVVKARRPGHRRPVRRGSFTHAGQAGPNSFRFTAKLHGKALAAGAYVLTATPTAAGLTGGSASVAFKMR